MWVPNQIDNTHKSGNSKCGYLKNRGALVTGGSLGIAHESRSRDG